jgi:hypothetical protein
MLLVAGLILIEMLLSDPEVFSDMIQSTLAAGGGMILLGFGGTFVLRNVYKQHSTYRRILSGIFGFLLLVMGIAGMEITADSSAMPYLIFGILFGIIDTIVGGYLIFGQAWLE